MTQLWLIWKNSIKTKSLNTKLCPAGLSPRIIRQGSHILPKMPQDCCTQQVWTVPPPSSELLWETLGMEKTPTQQLMVYSFKCNLDLYLQSLLLYHILNFRLYVHLFHANLTNQCLLNVAFNMTKALNVWSSPKRNFHSPHLSIPSLALMLFWKPCIYYCLFSSFPHSLFYSNLYKTSTDSTPIGVLCFAGKSAIVGLQVSWNKSYKTPYSMP